MTDVLDRLTEAAARLSDTEVGTPPADAVRRRRMARLRVATSLTAVMVVVLSFVAASSSGGPPTPRPLSSPDAPPSDASATRRLDMAHDGQIWPQPALRPPTLERLARQFADALGAADARLDLDGGDRSSFVLTVPETGAQIEASATLTSTGWAVSALSDVLVIRSMGVSRTEVEVRERPARAVVVRWWASGRGAQVSGGGSAPGEAIVISSDAASLDSVIVAFYDGDDRLLRVSGFARQPSPEAG